MTSDDPRDTKPVEGAPPGQAVDDSRCFSEFISETAPQQG
jgi:hypothetical protein